MLLAALVVGAALAGAGDEPSSAETATFLHYHKNGKRYMNFPRPGVGKPCGPSYTVGDTVGCGWLPNGEVFFTRAYYEFLAARAT